MKIRGMHIERATATGRITWVTLVGLVLVPLIIALGFLATSWHRDGRLGNVEGAIVNLDQAVKLNGKTVPLGRQLSAAIVQASGTSNITWVLSDGRSAQSGLRSGQYAIVVTIPQDFSKAATSISANSAAKATQATVSIQTSDATPVANSTIAQQIARIATTTFNTSMTRAYLENIYVGYNTVGKQFTTVADGAAQLAKGSQGLSSGVASASSGAAKLSDGLRQLDAAGSQFAGAHQLVTSGSQLSGGAASLASGASALSSGLSALNSGMPALTQGVDQLNTGAAQLADGIAQFQQQVASGTPDFSRLSQLQQGAQQVAAGTAGLSSGLGTVDSTLQGYADGSRTIPASSLPAGNLAQVEQGFVTGCTPGLTTGLTTALTQALTPQIGATAAARMAGSVAAQVAPSSCTSLGSSVSPVFLQGFDGGVKAGAGIGTRALGTSDPTSGLTLLEAASSVSAGASQLSAGVDQLAIDLPKQAAAQQQQLSAGLAQLRTGADQVAAGTSQLATNTGQLSSGVGRTAGGASSLATGASSLSTGVGQYVSGVGQLVGGLQQYADGVHQASTGSAGLADGMAQLQTGADKLNSGLTHFSQQLAAGAKKVPSYSEAARTKLSSVAAEPVAQKTTLPQVPLVATTLLLSVVALWIGALVVFLVVRPVPSRVLTSSRSSVSLVWASVAPGAAVAVIQAVVFGLVDAAIIGLSVGRGAGLTAMLVLIGLTFVTVNHALAAWLGGVGRLLSLVVATLGAAVGLISAVPGAFSTITSFTPIAPALDGVRSIVAGVTNVSGPVAWLVLWLVIAAVASILSVVRHRRLSASGYRRQLAASGA